MSARWGGENPDPFPDLTGYKGTPIILLSDSGSKLTVVNFSVIREATGQSEPFRTITKSNDLNKRFQDNEYAAVPIKALEYNETYRVTYSGTLNGAPIGKTFTFKTMVKPRTIITCRNPYTGEVYKCYEDTMERV